MTILSTIRAAIAAHATQASDPSTAGQAAERPAEAPLAFPRDHQAAAAATPALAAALAAAPGSISGGVSGGMSGGVLGAIASPRPITRPSAAAVLDALAAARGPGQADWRHSPADLLRLLDLDASPVSLRLLAEELGCTGTGDLTEEINAGLRSRLAIPRGPAEPLRHAS